MRPSTPPRPGYGCRSWTAAATPPAAGPDLPAPRHLPAAGKHAAGRGSSSFSLFLFIPFLLRAERKRKASAMTSQIPDQIPLPGPLGGAAPPAADGARRCKQPGCGAQLPVTTGRGAPRLFCSPACSRKWHNDNRLTAEAAGQQQAAAGGGPLAGLQQLLTQAAELAGAAAAQLAAADPGRVSATLATADAARRQAQADVPVWRGVTWMVMVAVPEAARSPRAQLTVPAVWLQLPWVAAAEAKLVLAGSVSVRTTPLAPEGPRLLTVAVYASVCPRSTGSGESTSLRARSATGRTVTATSAVSHLGSARPFVCPSSQ